MLLTSPIFPSHSPPSFPLIWQACHPETTLAWISPTRKGSTDEPVDPGAFRVTAQVLTTTFFSLVPNIRCTPTPITAHVPTRKHIGLYCSFIQLDFGRRLLLRPSM